MGRDNEETGFEMEIWPTGATGLGRGPSQSRETSTRAMRRGGLILCKDRACIDGGNWCDCDGAVPPKSPAMSRRYAPYPTPFRWECQPCPDGCEDLTDLCTDSCVQVAVPCIDACISPKDCDTNTPWDWHHCPVPPQFAAMSEIPFSEDLQLFDCCPNPNTYYPQNECCIPFPGDNLDQQTAHDAGLAALFRAYHPPSPTQALSTAPTPELSPADFFPRTQSSLPSSSAASFSCRWSDCGQCFSSLEELVGHVNLAHLRLPASVPSHDHAHGAPACHVAPPPSPAPSQPNQPDPLACPWSDCSIIPAPVDAGADFNASLCALASHLFHDHLNLPTATPGELFGLQSPMSQDVPTPAELMSPTSSRVSPAPSPASNSTPTHSHSLKGKGEAPSAEGTHTCGWEGCTETFPTSTALTEHLGAVHVGRGKASYDCHWTDCTRNGPTNGFSSKQKVLRHLQSHTGHRPFRCEVCGLDFSEAATLQQHMRRHTQEKPYVCDHPGCGKAFAITGALTIHKRTHNGDKPFKCKYCERAFSESSNLSKHLRTHTGQRPYACTEPGCGKKFSRPDQVTRHMLVHRKKDKDKQLEESKDEDEEMDAEVEE